MMELAILSLSAMGGFDWATFWESMSSSAQAAVSVILVMVYGYAVRKWGFVSADGESAISRLSTTIFLPALLFSEIGPLATVHNMANYWPIIPLSVAFQALSLLVAKLSHWFFKMPEHYVPLFVFNNVTSLPLLLVDTLANSGSFDVLLQGDESIKALARRAKAYLLVNALVGNLLRFALGPYLMKSHKSCSWRHPHHDDPHCDVDDDEDKRMPGAIQLPATHEDERVNSDDYESDLEYYDAIARKYADKAYHAISKITNPPLIGGAAALICGLIPALHRWLFEQGWLAAVSDSISNIGNLFSALQMFIIGAHLYSKKGSPASYIILLWLYAWRFFILPTIAISTVYGIRKRWPRLMESDPLLDYVLMTGNAGPPALTLSAIADLADLDPEVNGQISRIIMLSYVVTPLVAFPITAALTVIGIYKAD